MPTSFCTLFASSRPLFMSLVATWIPAMRFCMLGPSQCNKVFYAIVIVNAIDVVNVFVRLQRSAMSRFPYDTMFKDITFTVCSWITRHEKQHMTSLIDSTAFPFVALLSGLESSRSVPSQVRRWVALKMASAAICVVGDWRWQATTAFTDTGRNFFRARVIRLIGLRDALVSSCSFGSMSRQVRYRVSNPITHLWICVSGEFVDRLPASTFANTVRRFAGLGSVLTEVHLFSTSSPIIALIKC